MTSHDRRTSNPDALAIVGIGCLFPKAAGLADYWTNIKRKIDGIGPIPPTHWNPDDYFDADPKRPDMTYARRGGFLDPYPFPPAEFGIAPNDLEATDTSQLLALVVAKMALDDSGVRGQGSGIRDQGSGEPTALASQLSPALPRSPAPSASLTPDPRPLTPTRTSVILGVTGTLELVVPLGARLGHPLWRKALRDCGVRDDVAERVVERISRGYVAWQENSFPGLLGNVVAGRIANRLDFNGTNCVVDAACASSLSAIHLAALELQTGRCDVAITGGVDTFNDIFMYMCFSKTPALSPTGDAKPFDTAGDGTILGEGLGIIVLKRLADAERDGHRIYAVIRGIGTSSDGKGEAVYAPSSAGQIRCLRDAYANAGVTPDTIELIEAHGTGTKVGDAAELDGLSTVFRETPATRAPWCALGSVKSQLGHTKAAAGAAGLIKAAMALYHKVLPPTIKVSQPLAEPGTTPFYINTEPRPWLPRAEHPRRAGVSAFGFGGSNFHCVLEEYDARKPGIDWDGDVAILALSGANIGRLQTQLRQLPVEWSSFRACAAESRRSFDPSAPERLAVVVERPRFPDLVAISDWLTDRSRPAPTGIYFGTGPAPGQLAFLFPGQGSQYVGMLRDLACAFPAMQETLDEADRAVAGDVRLSDRIYPHPAFTPEARAAQEAALRATDVAQPAIGAVSVGALRILEQFGIQPDSTAGHSYGELAALCAAGCFDAPTLFALSRLRGRLMGELRNGDAGAMLAVSAPIEQVEALLEQERLNVRIANRNAPNQAVLSGASVEIERAATALTSRKMTHVRLPVAAAFHSPLVSDAAGPFRSALDAAAIRAPVLPVFANTTSQPYPSDPTKMRDLLARQLAEPVEFVEEIRAMARAGASTFVEIGPGRTLTRLVDSILGEEPHTALALDASAGKRNGLLDLAELLARLAALGYPVRLSEWDPNPPAPPKPAAFTVPICGANYRKPVKPEINTIQPQMHTDARGTANRRASESISDRDNARLPPSAIRNAQSPHESAPMPNDPKALTDALRITQESLAAFQKLQEQTAQLHKQFLESQETAQRTLQALVEGQQRLVAASLGAPMPAAPPPPASAPVAAVAPTPAPHFVPAPAAPVAHAPGSKPPVPTADASGSKETDAIERVLIEIIAEKTGYPPEMLGPDMKLDADLGIDSIKRVEILSALQDKLPNAPVIKPEHLGTLHTLREIAEFLRGSAAPPAPVAHAPGSLPARPVADAPGANTPDAIERVLIEIIAEKTGYPPEMLGSDMKLDADLGIDSIKRVEILSALQDKLPNAPIIKPEHLGTLHTLREIAEFLRGSAAVTPVEPAAGLDRRVLRPAEAPPPSDRPLPRGPVWVVAEEATVGAALVDELNRRGIAAELRSWNDVPMSRPVDLAGLVLIAPSRGDGTPAAALAWMQSAGPALRTSGGAFVTVTHLDGAFGLTEMGPHGDPRHGSLAGLAKTAAHEWPEVLCRALDLADGVSAAAVADELTRGGPVEIGLSPGRRVTLDLIAAPLPALGAPTFGAGDVVAITGGARGVTAEVAVEIARTGATVALIGRSPRPEPESPELAACPDEVALKRAVATRGGLTPKQLDAEVRGVLAAREIRRTLDRIAAAGGRALYLSADVRRPDDVAAAITEIRRSAGPVTALIHGAGVLADRRIEDLTAEQFDSVYATKVAGLENLLAAIGEDPVKALVVFSSSTGRFGRAGQAAYAAANEALNKWAQRESRRRPGCRVASINWGPWAGGMVTPALAERFAAERIALIPLADGARHLLAELVAPDRAVETVVLGPGSAIPEPQPAAEAMHLAFERELDLDRAPVLRAHVIDGRAVLPMALTLEWMAHAALHGHPGWTFHGCDGLRIFHPATIRDGETVRIQAMASRASGRGGDQRVTVELHGPRAGGRSTTFSRAEILLGSTPLADGEARLEIPRLAPLALDPDDVYQRVLFHGPELRGIERIIGSGSEGIEIVAQTAPPPGHWLDQPLRGQWLTDPLVLDCAFQAMSVWCHAERGAVSLPSTLGRYRQFRRFPTGTVTIRCRVTATRGQIVVADVEFRDPAGEVVARISNFECVLDPSLNQAFRRNRLEPAGV